MFLKFLFPKGKQKEIVNELRLLEKYTPQYLGEHENRHKSDIPLTDEKAADCFYDNNTVGFFVHAENCCYDMSLGSTSPHELKVYIEDSEMDISWAVDLFHRMHRLGAIYGFCCQLEEQDYRNKLVCALPKMDGRYEAWVGRDISKYIPGLYGITYISSEQITEKQLDTSLLLSNAESSYEYEDSSILFVFFSNLANWSQYTAKLDSLCNEVEGIFSNYEVARQAESLNEFWQLHELFRKWP